MNKKLIITMLFLLFSISAFFSLELLLLEIYFYPDSEGINDITEVYSSFYMYI